MENDPPFVDAEPYTYYENHTRIPSLWDTIYPGTFVAISDPDAAGVKGK